VPYCPNCGSESETEAVYCGSCGARLEGEGPPPPPPLPVRGRPRWAIVGGVVALVALVAGGIVLYNAVTGDGDGQERQSDGGQGQAVAVTASPTLPAVAEPTATVEGPAVIEETPRPTATAVPPPSGQASPEEAIADWVAPREYAGDCSAVSVEEDVGKICSNFYGGSGPQLVYLVGLTFSEFGDWVLVEQQGDGSWLVADSAPIGEALEPPWPVAPEPSVIGYDLPEEAINVYLEGYGLAYAGDCAYVDLETDIGSYCSMLWEDRGDQLIYSAGLAFSEPEAWLLLALQGEAGGWLVVDAAEFVPGPQDTVPPWP
jgi:hypothetical protein